MEINLELKNDDTIEIKKLEIQYPYSISNQEQYFYRKVYWQDETSPIDYSQISKTDDKKFLLTIRQKIFLPAEYHKITFDYKIDSDLLLNEKIFGHIHWSQVYNRYVIQPRMYELPDFLFINDLKKANETILFTLYENGVEYKYSTQNKAIFLKLFMNISHSS